MHTLFWNRIKQCFSYAKIELQSASKKGHEFINKFREKSQVQFALNMIKQFRELDLLSNIDHIEQEFNDFLEETDEMIENYKEMSADADALLKEI